jgi:hypothetical protein
VFGVGRFLLNQLLQLILNRNGNSLGPLPTNGGQSSQTQQEEDGQDSPDLEGILDEELLRRLEEYLETQPLMPDDTDSVNIQQGNTGANTQLLRQTWNVARECLNDVFSPNEGGSMTEGERQAAISEARSVLQGRTALSQASAQLRLNWPVIRRCIARFADRNDPTNLPVQSQFLSLFGLGDDDDDDECIAQLYVMAFTDDVRNSQTRHPPFMELTVGGEAQLAQLPAVTGREFQQGKGDLWAIDIIDFGFTDSCINKQDIDGVAVVEGGTDGWKIDSIVTFVRDVDGEFELLSTDIGVNRWIDGNFGPERERFDLSLDDD